MSVGDELVRLYGGTTQEATTAMRSALLKASDHATPYAPLPIVPTLRPRARLMLFEALAIAGRVTVVASPLRVLMPADSNPFPRLRLFRWLR